MSTGQMMHAQAVANELAGERKSSTVSFPITGDVETDFISGVIALASQTPYMSTQRKSMVARALAYLSTRFHDEAEAQEKQAEQMARMQQPGYPPQNYGMNQANQIQNFYQQALGTPMCPPSIGLGGFGITTTSDPSKDY